VHRQIIVRMAFASPAIHAPRRARLPVPPGPDGAGPADLRDALTRRRLLAAVGHLPGLTVEHFDREWWDGQARVACLIVRGGRRMRRLRVVETEGQCVVVPFSRRLAHRWLAARRRPRRAELDGVGRRTRGSDVVVDAWADAVRCGTAGCGVLRPLAYPGCCPVCGG
jgi:hypothetical protein